MERSPPHTLEGEELDYQKKKDETRHKTENSSLTSNVNLEDKEAVSKLGLPNEPSHPDETVSKSLGYFYILFNHLLQCDLHRSQNEVIQKKNHPDVVDLHRNQDEENQNKNCPDVVAHLHQSYHHSNQK